MSKKLILLIPIVLLTFGCDRTKKTTKKTSTQDRRTTATKRSTTKKNVSTHDYEVKTLYVSVVGIDSNDGLDIEKPTTLLKALDAMNTGDTIKLLAGTYTLNNILNITRSGSEVQRNILSCENGVIIDFSSTKEDDTANNGGLFISGSYWEIDNLNIINSDNYGFNVTGRGVKLNDCTSKENNSGGFYFNSSLTTVTNCLAENNYLAGYSAYGFYISGTGDNNTFDSCISINNQDSGFVLVDATKPVTFNKCLAISNGLNGDSASAQRSGFVFNNKGHTFTNCIAYNNALNGFLVPLAYASKGSYSLINCESINNHVRNFYLRTNNTDTVVITNILSFNNYDSTNVLNDYIIGNVTNSIMYYSKAYYYEKSNPNYSSLDISKIPLDLSGYENSFIINMEIPEEMKEYIDLEEKARIDEEAEAAGVEPDYSSLEYNIIYYKDGELNIYDYLDRAIAFQDELFTKLTITNPTYFGADVNPKIEENE